MKIEKILTDKKFLSKIGLVATIGVIVLNVVQSAASDKMMDITIEEKVKEAVSNQN